MARLSRRYYLRGTVAALGGLLAAACGEVEVRYVQGPPGPPGPAGPQGEKGAAGPRGAKGAAGAAGKTVIVEKKVEVPVPAKAPAPIKLVLMQRASDAEQFAKVFAEKYTRAHPHITVEFMEIPYSGYWTKLLTLHASDTLPDLAWSWNAGFGGNIAEQAAKGIYRAVDEFVAADKYDLGQFYPGAINACRWEGKLWGLPTIAHPGHVSLLWNNNHLKSAGATPPDENTTPDELIEKATRVGIRDTNNDGKPDIWGFHDWRRSYWTLVARMRAYGGGFLSEDGKRTLMNTEGSKAALQWQYDVMYKQRVSPNPVDNPKVYGGRPFLEGKFALMGGNIHGISTTRAKVGDKFEWGVTLFPKGPVTRGTALHANTISTTRQTKHPRESWELMKLLASHEAGVEKIIMKSGSPGGRPDVWNDKRLWEIERVYQLGAKIMPDAVPLGVAYNLRTVEAVNVWLKGIRGIWSKKVGFRDGVEETARLVQVVLDKPR